MDEDTEAQGAYMILGRGLVGAEVGASFLLSPSTQSPRSWGIHCVLNLLRWYKY